MATTEVYDALTLELERSRALVQLLVDRLEDLSVGADDTYQLAVVAQCVLQKHDVIRDKAQALWALHEHVDAGGVR
jgi:hypothetical protein